MAGMDGRDGNGDDEGGGGGMMCIPLSTWGLLLVSFVFVSKSIYRHKCV